MYEVAGKVTFLRTLDLNLSPPWGPAGDELTTCNVIVKISGDTSKAFGLELRSNDPELATRMGMVNMLREAYLHDKEVSVGFMDQPTSSRHNFMIARVEWGTQ
jgi:hypothetical protein